MTSPRRRLALLLLAALPLAMLALVVVPAWYIQPFRPQTAEGLDRALAARDLSPTLTLVAALVSIALAAALWRGTSRWSRRIGLVVAPLLAIGAAGLSRFNHFEMMFAPLPAPEYARANEADFVEASDIVLAVEIAGEAVGYPVRQMAYHHVVQDVVGGVPLVATY